MALSVRASSDLEFRQLLRLAPARHQRQRPHHQGGGKPSKVRFLYVLDRTTGVPVWPIEERPVPQSDVPGEKTSPTRPFPTKPPAYSRNMIRVPDDLIDFTPELRAQAHEAIKRYRVGASPFTPPMLGDSNGILGAVGSGTATNWPGSAADPELHVVYAQAGNLPSSRSIVAPPASLGYSLCVGSGGTTVPPGARSRRLLRGGRRAAEQRNCRPRRQPQPPRPHPRVALRAPR
jgi:hypothetical protein